jgi:geranylgeranyl transferase type-2 subunit beta
MADIFHTFFGIAGLNLLGHFKDTHSHFRDIDPTYALPKDIVLKLGLVSQKLENV